MTDKIVLTAGGNDYDIKIKDYLVQSIEADANAQFATLRMIPCVLFLNGEYWGVYYMSESYNAEFIKSHYGIKKSNVVMIKDKKLEEGMEDDIKLYEEMIDFIVSNDMSIEDNYNKACELIDVESFVDYYATEIFIGNCDWPNNNERLWRAREEDYRNPYCDGKWRWMLYDINVNMVLSDYQYDMFSTAADRSAIFHSLLQNPKIRELFRERFKELEDKIYTKEHVEEFTNEWLAVMQEPLQNNQKRFFGTEDVKVTSKINDINNFIQYRPEYINRYMEEYFDKLSK